MSYVRTLMKVLRRLGELLSASYLWWDRGSTGSLSRGVAFPPILRKCASVFYAGGQKNGRRCCNYSRRTGYWDTWYRTCLAWKLVPMFALSTTSLCGSLPTSWSPLLVLEHWLFPSLVLDFGIAWLLFSFSMHLVFYPLPFFSTLGPRLGLRQMTISGSLLVGWVALSWHSLTLLLALAGLFVNVIIGGQLVAALSGGKVLAGQVFSSSNFDDSGQHLWLQVCASLRALCLDTYGGHLCYYANCSGSSFPHSGFIEYHYRCRNCWPALLCGAVYGFATGWSSMLLTTTSTSQKILHLAASSGWPSWYLYPLRAARNTRHGLYTLALGDEIFEWPCWWSACRCSQSTGGLWHTHSGVACSECHREQYPERL